MTQDFTIDKVSWHTKQFGKITSDEDIHSRFRILILFLQENKLTNRVILNHGEPVTDDTEIKRSDLTEKGFQLIKKCHDKWLKGIDRGKGFADIGIFEKELAKLSD